MDNKIIFVDSRFPGYPLWTITASWTYEYAQQQAEGEGERERERRRHTRKRDARRQIGNVRARAERGYGLT